jgi:hypothetical protein
MAASADGPKRPLADLRRLFNGGPSRGGFYIPRRRSHCSGAPKVKRSSEKQLLPAVNQRRQLIGAGRSRLRKAPDLCSGLDQGPTPQAAATTRANRGGLCSQKENLRVPDIASAPRSSSWAAKNGWRLSPAVQPSTFGAVYNRRPRRGEDDENNKSNKGFAHVP